MAQTTGRFSETAKTGFAKGSAYDQHRPAYSSTIVQLLLENLGLDGKHGAKILDLAAGTGKFTEALAARGEQYEIVAVEPQDDMRQVLTEKNLNGVTVKNGNAESIPLSSGSVDAVICAQVGSIFSPVIIQCDHFQFSYALSLYRTRTKPRSLSTGSRTRMH